jgi:hypothetical protein
LREYKLQWYHFQVPIVLFLLCNPAQLSLAVSSNSREQEHPRNLHPEQKMTLYFITVDGKINVHGFCKRELDLAQQVNDG